MPFPSSRQPSSRITNENRASSTQINFFPPGWETRHPGNCEPTTRPDTPAYRLRRVGNPRSDRLARDGPPGATEWRRARDVTSTSRAVFSHDSYPGSNLRDDVRNESQSINRSRGEPGTSFHFAEDMYVFRMAIGARTTRGIGERGRAGGGWRRCGRLKTLRMRVGVGLCRLRRNKVSVNQCCACVVQGKCLRLRSGGHRVSSISACVPVESYRRSGRGVTEARLSRSLRSKVWSPESVGGSALRES
jgi:hypothetical protein